MANRVTVSRSARLARWRVWVQAGFLLVWLDPLAMQLHSVCGPVFHCYSCPLATFACPIGVLANFSALHVFPFLAFGTLTVAGALVGSLVCGWACPFGFLQDLLGRIPTRKFELPGWMGGFRYLVLLGLVLAVPYWLGENHPLFICRVCPAGALEGALPNMAALAVAGKPVLWPSAVKMAILATILLAAVFVWRPWCTLFCPLGAIYGLCNHFSIFFLRFHPERCRDCNLCQKLCQYHARSDQRERQLQCVRCLDCTRCNAVTLSNVFASGGKREEAAR